MPKLNQNRSYVITLNNHVMAVVQGSREYASAVKESLAIKHWKKQKADDGTEYISYYKVYRRHNAWKAINAKTFSELEG